MNEIKIISTELIENPDKISVERLPAAIGFSLMLAWHYLILFSPAFGDSVSLQSLGMDYVFYRQITLYLSLAFCFYLIWVYGKWRRPSKEQVRKRTSNIPITGAASIVAGALFSLSQYFELPLYFQLAFMVALGMLQAYMMTLWMRCLMKRYNGNVISSFGIFMISGGAIAILISFLQWPVMIIGAVILPGLSSMLLSHERRIDIEKELESEKEENDPQDASNDDDTDHDGVDTTEGMIDTDPIQEAKTDPVSFQKSVEIAEQRRLSTRNKRMILFAAVFSLTIGLLQGSFIIKDIPILFADHTVVLTGVMLAGVLLHFIPKNLGITLSIDMMHRFSVILFVLGCVVIMWYSLGHTPVALAQIALLAGFNLFDFGMFAYGIEGYWNRDRDPYGADSGRPVVYLCMSSGLFIGYFITNSISHDNIFVALLIICGIGIMSIVFTTLMPFFRLSHDKEDSSEQEEDSEDALEKKQPVILSLSSFPTETAIVDSMESDASAQMESPWKNACRAIAEHYRLSPRETEIFMLVAKGRNADYIQSKLVISTHTAKTHIANIYHKLAIHSAQELLDLVEEYRGNNG